MQLLNGRMCAGAGGNAMGCGQQVAESVEELNPKCVARCKEFSVEALVTSQVTSSG